MFNKKVLVLAIGSCLCSYNAISADVNFSGYGSFRAGKLLDDNFTPPFQTYESTLIS